MHENILIYDSSYKALIGAKPLNIRFYKIHGFIRNYDGNRYLTLFGSEKYDVIYNRVKYVIGIKSAITYVSSHYYAKIKLILMIAYRKKTVTVSCYNTQCQFSIKLRITTTITYPQKIFVAIS